jgi:hypothetical protein
MAEAYGNTLVPPGTSQVAEVKPGDVLASYSPPPLIKGGTIKGGAGLLAAGTVMGLEAATKKYIAYTDTGAGDPAVGVLMEAVDTGAASPAGDKLGNIIMRGTVKMDKLTGYDAAALADLNGRVINRSTEGSNAGDYIAF